MIFDDDIASYSNSSFTLSPPSISYSDLLQRDIPIDMVPPDSITPEGVPWQGIPSMIEESPNSLGSRELCPDPGRSKSLNT